MPRPGAEGGSAYTRFNDAPTEEDLEVGFGDDVQRLRTKTGGRLGYASGPKATTACTSCSCSQWLGIALGGFVALVPSDEYPQPIERNSLFVAFVLFVICALGEAFVIRAEGHKCFAFCTKAGRANSEYCRLFTQAATDIVVVMCGYALGLGLETVMPTGGAAVVGGVALLIYAISLAFQKCRHKGDP
jgi:hypothetical protein